METEINISKNDVEKLKEYYSQLDEEYTGLRDKILINFREHKYDSTNKLILDRAGKILNMKQKVLDMKQICINQK